MYPPIWSALVTVGLDEIRVYIAHHQNMVAQYISTCNIMELCLAVELNPELQLSGKWWEQYALDIPGIQDVHAAADLGGEKGMEESEGEGD